MRMYDALETALPVLFAMALVAAFALLASVAIGHAEMGAASVYGTGDRDQNGSRTASGIPLRNDMPTIAHKTLPLKSYARVTNLRTGVSAEFRVTDRGPYVRGRIVDLSHAAAKVIGISGLGRVSVEAVR